MPVSRSQGVTSSARRSAKAEVRGANPRGSANLICDTIRLPKPIMKKRNPISGASAVAKTAPSLRLVSPRETVPVDLEAVLLELGAGDSRFRGLRSAKGTARWRVFYRNVVMGKIRQKPRRTMSRSQVIGWLIEQKKLWPSRASDIGSMSDCSSMAATSATLRAAIGARQRLRKRGAAAGIGTAAPIKSAPRFIDRQSGQRVLNRGRAGKRRGGRQPGS